ncbi:phosphotransferase family protein [Microlunatus endophyticus]|uniref:phosphotransferase family protein n=1 Tax=Microlunatus endophyticus TaxID=1716077 RepID=UPI001663AAE5|nr:aminoglycoside phosphotransferase family protein [Microlunatus endophyticus]
MLEATVRWAGESIGAEIESMQPLRDGHSPWRLQVRGGDDVVLRVTQPGWRNADPVRTNAAALRVAERNDLAAPRLLAVDWDGELAGTPATVETVLSGSSAPPSRVSPSRLRAFGAAIARVHTVPLEPRTWLPHLTRSKQYDHPMMRRWAALYRSSPDSEKSDIVRRLGQLTGMSQETILRTIDAPPGSALLHVADERVRATPRLEGQSVLLHGDVWAGNALWDGDKCVGLIDWKDAGVGDPGIDLGLLRLNMTLQYGSNAASYVLEGWQGAAGRAATHLAYWDTVAALNTPTVLDDPGFDDDGEVVSAEVVSRRRDTFLAEALSAVW